MTSESTVEANFRGSVEDANPHDDKIKDVDDLDASADLDFVETQIPQQYFYDFTGKRGLAIIFNHFKYMAYKFKKEPPQRSGTAADVKKIRETFELLKFDVEAHTDLTYNEIMDEMEKVAKRDHKSTSCLVVCVLTHGEEHGVLYAADCTYSTSKLFDAVAGDACPALATKPKLFFIQACRGKSYEDGVRVQLDGHGSAAVRLPTTANFLMMYSTVENFVSWRDSDGSWFMQALCDELQSRYMHMDLFHILTMVNWHIAHCRSSNTGLLWSHDKKQMPQIVSTLTKLVRFG